MKMLRALSLALILSVPAFMNAAGDEKGFFSNLGTKTFNFVDSATGLLDWSSKKAAGAKDAVLDWTWGNESSNIRVFSKSVITAAVAAVAAVVAKKLLESNKDARFECEDCDN